MWKPTDHETLVLAAVEAFVEASGRPIHGYPLARQLESEELAERSMNYATLYRILDRLEHRGLLCCHPDEPGRYPGRPRRRFDLTRAGRALLRDLALAGAPNAQVAIIDGRLRFVGER